MPATTTERVVSLQQGLIRTKVLNKGDGPPLLFLHSAYGLNWDPFLDDLAGRFSVYAPEFPGTGDSEGLEQIDNLFDLILYHYDLLDALQLRSPVVVGTSYGGMVAAEIAACNPERVSKLVLVDPIGLWRDDHPVADYVGMSPQQLAAIVYYDQELGKQQLTPPEDKELAAAMRIRQTKALAATSKFVWPIPDKGLSKRLHRIQAPTLIVWGKHDGLVSPVYAEEFASRIPDARVKLIDKAAHVPQVEQREQVSKLVLDFLT